MKSIKRNRFYIILKDFIDRTLDGYENVDPTYVGSLSQNFVNYYQLIFSKRDGSQYDIKARVFQRTSVVKIDEEKQLRAATVQETFSFKDVETDLIFKDPYFILVRDGIDSKLRGKYKNARIKSV